MTEPTTKSKREIKADKCMPGGQEMGYAYSTVDLATWLLWFNRATSLRASCRSYLSFSSSAAPTTTPSWSVIGVLPSVAGVIGMESLDEPYASCGEDRSFSRCRRESTTEDSSWLPESTLNF